MSEEEPIIKRLGLDYLTGEPLLDQLDRLMALLDEGSATLSGIARHLNRREPEIETLYWAWKRRQKSA